MRHVSTVGPSRFSGGPRSLLANAILALLPLAPIRGRTWLAQKTREKVQPRGDLTVRMTDGSVMVLPAKSSQSWNPAAKGSYDLPSMRLIQWFAKPESVVVDIGACFGLYSVPLGQVGKELGWSVLAIEPVESNAGILKRNIELNSLDHVIQLERAALGAKSGTVLLDIEESGTGNAAIRSGNEAFHKDHCITNSAQILRLDDLAISSPISCVKIDVEGYEMEVLLGGENRIRRDRPIIVGEFEPWQLELRGVTVSDLFTWCRDHCYVLFSLDLVRKRPFLDTQIARIIRTPRQLNWTGCILLPEEREAEIVLARDFANSSSA